MANIVSKLHAKFHRANLIIKFQMVGTVRIRLYDKNGLLQKNLKTKKIDLKNQNLWGV